MTRPAEFTAVTRNGTRARRGALVVHELGQLSPDTSAAPRVGLIVGRAVGGSVVRHRVSRRLRAQLASRVNKLPTGCGVVVRALPEAADATSAQLAQDLDRALERLGH
jgi:ribonuclease P protein component